MIWKDYINKVLKGVYPKIPKHFSEELSTIVRLMLSVNPKKRPSWSQLLDHDIIRDQIELLFPEEFNDTESILLSTIRCPKNLLFLTDRLPKPRYQTNILTKESDSDSESNEETSMNKLPNLSKNQIFGIVKGLKAANHMSLVKSRHSNDYPYNGKLIALVYNFNKSIFEKTLYHFKLIDLNYN